MADHPHHHTQQHTQHGTQQDPDELARRLAAQEERNQHLTAALDNRTVIGQATGMLMERFGLTAERAFDVLRRMSSEHQRKLRDVAAAVVTGRQPEVEADWLRRRS